MPFVSRAQICNMGLSAIHYTDTKISNLDTDTGKAASECRIHYDTARRFVLADHNWNFATKRRALVDLGNPPADWAFRYDYPDDCLKFQSIQRPNRNLEPIVFSTEEDGSGNGGLSILTDQPTATGIYTYDVENTGLFSPMFVTAFSYFLGSLIAPALTGSLQIQEATLTVYRNFIDAAQTTDSQEGQPDKELDSPWERARIGGEFID